MPGNELDLINYLLENRNKITLDHLGVIKEIGAPKPKKQNGYIKVDDVENLKKISSEDSQKKADVYINGKGISIKQSGGSFSYNRLQRAELLKFFESLQFKDAMLTFDKIGREVHEFHLGNLDKRNRKWNSFFTELEFKRLLEHLMLKGGINIGLSRHQVDYIMEAPKKTIGSHEINVYTFDEYFEKYKDKFMISIRRQWIGQSSKSENQRATGLAKKEGNFPWVYNEVAGTPSNGWNLDYSENERKTVYFLMIEKTR